MPEPSEAPVSTKLVFQMGLTAEGKPVWTCRDIPLAVLNLLLDTVKLDILTGKVTQQATAIVPGTNGDLDAINRLNKELGR